METGLHDTYNREFAEPVLTDRPVEGAEGLAENILWLSGACKATDFRNARGMECKEIRSLMFFLLPFKVKTGALFVAVAGLFSVMQSKNKVADRRCADK